MTDRIANSGKPMRSFDETYRTAFDFLGNPIKLWHSPNIEDRRALLKLVFAERLSFDRKGGYRTAKISTPFKMLGDMKMSKNEMVRAVGIEPTLLSEPDFESGASTSSATPATDAPETRQENRGRTIAKARPRQSGDVCEATAESALRYRRRPCRLPSTPR